MILPRNTPFSGKYKAAMLGCSWIIALQAIRNWQSEFCICAELLSAAECFGYYHINIVVLQCDEVCCSELENVVYCSHFVKACHSFQTVPSTYSCSQFNVGSRYLIGLLCNHWVTSKMHPMYCSYHRSERCH